MKRRIGLCLAMLLLPAFFGTWQGCKNLNTASYKVAQGTEITVDAAMTAWGQYVSANHPSIDAERKVNNAYKQYQAAAMAVADAGIAYNRAKAVNSPDVAVQQAALNATLDAVANALNDLVAILRKLGVKI